MRGSHTHIHTYVHTYIHTHTPLIFNKLLYSLSLTHTHNAINIGGCFRHGLSEFANEEELRAGERESDVKRRAKDLFARAQAYVFRHLETEYYQRFVLSDAYFAFVCEEEKRSEMEREKSSKSAVKEEEEEEDAEEVKTQERERQVSATSVSTAEEEEEEDEDEVEGRDEKEGGEGDNVSVVSVTGVSSRMQEISDILETKQTELYQVRHSH